MIETVKQYKLRNKMTWEQIADKFHAANRQTAEKWADWWVIEEHTEEFGLVECLVSPQRLACNNEVYLTKADIAGFLED